MTNIDTSHVEPISCTGCANPLIKEPDRFKADVAAILTPAVEDQCDILNVKCDFKDPNNPDILRAGYMIFNENEDLNINPSAALPLPTTSLTCSGGSYKYNGGVAINSVACPSFLCDTCDISYGLQQSPLPIITYDDLNAEACRKGTITCDFKNDNPTSGIMHFATIDIDGTTVIYVAQTPGPPQPIVKVDFTCVDSDFAGWTSPTGEVIEFQFVSCTGNQP